MNVLSADKRARILALHAEGATLREIERTVDCHRETARALIDAQPARPLTDEEKVAWVGPALFAVGKAVERLVVALESMGIDPYGAPIADSLIAIQTIAIATCPRHPDAVPWEDAHPDFGCTQCGTEQRRRTGLQRHHARRKAEGRPVLPPWQGIGGTTK